MGAIVMDETATPVEADEPMVSIPKANATWLLNLLDQLKFGGSDGKQEAAIVQRSLEQALKE